MLPLSGASGAGRGHRCFGDDGAQPGAALLVGTDAGSAPARRAPEASAARVPMLGRDRTRSVRPGRLDAIGLDTDEVSPSLDEVGGAGCPAMEMGVARSAGGGVSARLLGSR